MLPLRGTNQQEKQANCLRSFGLAAAAESPCSRRRGRIAPPSRHSRRCGTYSHTVHVGLHSGPLRAFQPLGGSLEYVPAHPSTPIPGTAGSVLTARHRGSPAFGSQPPPDQLSDGRPSQASSRCSVSRRTRGEWAVAAPSLRSGGATASRSPVEFVLGQERTARAPPRRRSRQPDPFRAGIHRRLAAAGRSRPSRLIATPCFQTQGAPEESRKVPRQSRFPPPLTPLTRRASATPAPVATSNINPRPALQRLRSGTTCGLQSPSSVGSIPAGGSTLSSARSSPSPPPAAVRAALETVGQVLERHADTHVTSRVPQSCQRCGRDLRSCGQRYCTRGCAALRRSR